MVKIGNCLKFIEHRTPNSTESYMNDQKPVEIIIKKNYYIQNSTMNFARKFARNFINKLLAQRRL